VGVLEACELDQLACPDWVEASVFAGSRGDGAGDEVLVCVQEFVILE